MLSELTQDPARNALIADDVAQEAQAMAAGCAWYFLTGRPIAETLVELLAARGSPRRCLPVTCRRRTGARWWRP